MKKHPTPETDHMRFLTEINPDIERLLEFAEKLEKERDWAQEALHVERTKRDGKKVRK